MHVSKDKQSQVGQKRKFEGVLQIEVQYEQELKILSYGIANIHSMNPDNLAAQQLVEILIAAFPDDAALIDERMQSKGFAPGEAPYIWIEHFSQRTTDALKVGNTTRAVSHLNLISHLLSTADAPTERCIDVAYVESLMWDMNEEMKKKGWLLFPQNLRNLYVKMWGDKSFMDVRR